MYIFYWEWEIMEKSNELLHWYEFWIITTTTKKSNRSLISLDLLKSKEDATFEIRYNLEKWAANFILHNKLPIRMTLVNFVGNPIKIYDVVLQLAGSRRNWISKSAYTYDNIYCHLFLSRLYRYFNISLCFYSASWATVATRYDALYD